MRTIGNGTIRRVGEGVLYGSGNSIKQLCDWDLATNDDAATVEAATYFDGLIDVLQLGEKISARLDLDGTPTLRTYLVSANDGTHVTVVRENASQSEGFGLQIVPFFVNLADIAAGDVLTDYVPGFAFELEKIDFRVGKAVTTAAKAATIDLEIGTTAVTGGAVALTSANCTPAGAAVAGSAITAANVGTKTDSFSILASSVTAFAEGTGWILISLRNLEA